MEEYKRGTQRDERQKRKWEDKCSGALSLSKLWFYILNPLTTNHCILMPTNLLDILWFYGLTLCHLKGHIHSFHYRVTTYSQKSMSQMCCCVPISLQTHFHFKNSSWWLIQGHSDIQEWPVCLFKPCIHEWCCHEIKGKKQVNMEVVKNIQGIWSLIAV